MLTTRDIALATGTLRVDVGQAQWPLDALCAFAARRNPKRGFLVVSKVLGRHLPARPAEMRRSARDLAAMLPADLPGPVLVLGLAETAVCLGQLVHREWRALTGRDDLVFLHSTRQQVDASLLCRFEEPHSHAAAHLVYRPDVLGLPPFRSLVLVDDEVTTGTTLANLSAALVSCWPEVETVVGASLVDWSDGGWLARTGRPSRSMALLSGRLTWTPDHSALAEALPVSTSSLGRIEHHRNRGRLGWRGDAIDVPEVTVGATPIRVIGTGEFTYPPFLLAERLEAEGHDVVVQATSRSPVRLGGPIEHARTFADNYGAIVPNYLYNAPDDDRLNLICHETPPGSIDPALVTALDAQAIGWPA